MRHNLFSLLLPVFFIAAPASASDPELKLDHAWVRALPPTQQNTAAYLTIANHQDSDVTVVAVRSSAAATTQIHSSREVDGLMRMEHLQQLMVPAGQTVVLAPGGIHLMLLGLAAMPAEGTEVDICLTSASGRESCVRASVLREREAPDVHQHHH